MSANIDEVDRVGGADDGVPLDESCAQRISAPQKTSEREAIAMALAHVVLKVLPADSPHEGTLSVRYYIRRGTERYARRVIAHAEHTMLNRSSVVVELK